MSNPKFFDSHTHVQFQAFKEDAEIVIKRALDAGVWMVNVGTQKDTSLAAIKLAEKFEEALPAEASAQTGVYATAGLHPIHTEKSFHDPQELGGGNGFNSREEEFDLDYYKKLAQNPKVVAIGECGLDYYRFKNKDLGFKKKQEDAFIKQIELSKEIQKPLMIHCRDAFSDLINILKSNTLNLKSSPGIIHFFSGTKEDARKLLDLGFYFSFGGVITFTNDYEEVVKYIPLERILLETDAPYVSPVPYRGKRNEPLYVIEVAKKISEIKHISFEKGAETTTANARKVFRI